MAGDPPVCKCKSNQGSDLRLELFETELHKVYFENARLRKICESNVKTILSLEKVIRKQKKWYNLIIWQK